MNWLIITVFGISALAIIVFLVIRNKKDKKEFTRQLNNDYQKRRDEKGDIEINELTENVH